MADVVDGSPALVSKRRRSQHGSSKHRTLSASSLCAQCRQVPLPGHKAAYLGHIECLQTLQRDAPGKLEMVDRNGAVPLHLAVRQCNTAAVKWLLEQNPEQCTAKAHGGETPTLIAAAQGSKECLAVLASATPVSRRDLVKDTDVNGLSSVHLASLFDRCSTVKWLLKHFGHRLVVLQSISGITPVHIAAATGHLSVLKALLKSNKKGAAFVDASGATPAYFAAQEGQLECLRHLVQHGKVNALAVCDDGMTAVHAAAQGGHLDVLQFLVEVLGESVLLTPMQDKGTPVHFAAAMGHSEMLEWMLSQNGLKDSVHLTDAELGTPAHDAADNGQVKCLRVLKMHGADMCAKDRDGATPISLALENDDPECRKWALDERRLTDPAKRPSRMEADAVATLELTMLAMGGKKHVLPGVVEQTDQDHIALPPTPSRKKSREAAAAAAAGGGEDSDIYAVPHRTRAQKKQWDGSGPARLPASDAEKAAENALAVVSEVPVASGSSGGGGGAAAHSSDDSDGGDDGGEAGGSGTEVFGPPLMGSTPVRPVPRTVSATSTAVGPSLPPRTELSLEILDGEDVTDGAAAEGEKSADSEDLTDGSDKVGSQLLVTPKKLAPASRRPKSATTTRTNPATGDHLDLSRSNSDPYSPTKLVFDKSGKPIMTQYPRLTSRQFDSPSNSPRGSPVPSPAGSPLVIRKPFTFAARPPSSPTVSRAHSLPKTHANEAADTAASLRKKSLSLGQADSSHHGFIKKADIADLVREDEDD